jgi:hypothetical protein
MSAVNLVNVAVSVPDPVPGETGVHALLHQQQGNTVAGSDGRPIPVHDGKPLPRDPTATKPLHELGPRLTYVAVPDEGAVFCSKAGVMVNRKLSAADQARTVVHEWAQHSDCAVPAFVLPASSSKEDAALAEAVLARFQAKQPTEQDAEAYGYAFQVSGRGDKAALAYRYKERATHITPRIWLPGDEGEGLPASDLLLLLAAQETAQWEEMLAAIEGPVALILNAGVDSAHKNLFSTASADAQYNYMSLSANASAPAGSDTTLTGEITTGGGGLYPAQGTYAHTNGTTTSTVSKTFTTNGSDSLPVTIAQIGLRNAGAAGGTLGVKELLSATATLTTSGDALTVTYTLTSSAS